MKVRWIYAVVLACLTLAGCQADISGPELNDLSSPDAVAASLASVEAEDNLALFDYDSSQSLDIVEADRWQEDGLTWVDFTYASPMGGRVPALLVIPPGRGPFPAIMLQHGSMGHIEDMQSTAGYFASLGAVVIMIEDPYSRPGGWQPTEYMGATWPYYTAQDLEVKIQSIIDMRRAVDFLVARPDVDPERLAYYGVSYGAAMGGLLSGIEDRFAAYVLQVGDGGLVEHTSDPGPDGLPIHFSPGWAELMWPTEPLHFIGRASPAAILFLNGLQDVNVPPADALRFQAAASEPKTVYWYDADHALTQQAVYDAAEWLQPYLGSSLLWTAPNYRAGAVVIDWGLTLWMAAILVSLVLFWRWVRTMQLGAGLRLLWSLNIVLVGPLGLVLFNWLYRRGSETEFKRVIGAATYSATALSTGLFLGNVVQQILPQDLSGLGLLMLYLIFLLGSRLVHRLAWSTNPASRIAHLLVANIYWTIAVIASTPINEWLQTTTIFDPRTLWNLGLATLANIILCLPLHTWLLNRVMERWSRTTVADSRDQALEQLHWALSGGLSLASFTLVFASVIWLITAATGLTLSEFAQALQGR